VIGLPLSLPEGELEEAGIDAATKDWLGGELGSPKYWHLRRWAAPSPEIVGSGCSLRATCLARSGWKGAAKLWEQWRERLVISDFKSYLPVSLPRCQPRRAGARRVNVTIAPEQPGQLVSMLLLSRRRRSWSVGAAPFP